jgi:hypothetical protein
VLISVSAAMGGCHCAIFAQAQHGVAGAVKADAARLAAQDGFLLMQFHQRRQSLRLFRQSVLRPTAH